MINAIRLSIGNGRTYENVKIMTLAELGRRDAERLFGAATFCFQHQGKFRFVHSNNVNMIHLNRTRPALEGSVPYEKIVCCDESTYGPGVILSPHHLGRLGIDEFMTTDCWSPPLLVTSTPEGLVRLGSHHILRSSIADLHRSLAASRLGLAERGKAATVARS